MNQQNKAKYTLQSVDNALGIIDLLTQHSELGAADVSKLMGIGKSTAFRLLSTLENKGFIVRYNSMKYRLGIKFVSLGNIVIERLDIAKHVHPYLEELTKRTGETSHLVIWHKDTQVLFIDKVKSPATISMDTAIGVSMTAHLTATGKAILACCPEDAVRAYINKASFRLSTKNSIRNQEELLSDLVHVKERGYAVNDEEDELGLTSFGAALVDKAGVAVAAISIAGPSDRMNQKKMTNLSILTEIAKRIGATI